MNVREGFLFVVLSFLACSAYGVLAQGTSSDNPLCSQLTEKEFSIVIYDYEGSHLQYDDLHPYIQNNPQKTIDGKVLEFQEDRAKVIHIKALNPATRENEESYLVDDTYFFSSFLAVAELINKSRQGQSIIQGEINGVRLLLNELEETIDEVDDTLFGELKIEQNVREILHLLDLEEGEPLDIEALSRTLDEMGERNYYQPSGTISEHLHSYEGRREKVGLGFYGDWNWQSFQGPQLYGLGGFSMDYTVSLADQLFTAVHHTLSPNTHKGCTLSFAQSTIASRGVLVSHRSMLLAVLDFISGGDSRTEDVPVSVQRNNEGLR